MRRLPSAFFHGADIGVFTATMRPPQLAKARWAQLLHTKIQPQRQPRAGTRQVQLRRIPKTHVLSSGSFCARIPRKTDKPPTSRTEFIRHTSKGLTYIGRCASVLYFTLILFHYSGCIEPGIYFSSGSSPGETSFSSFGGPIGSSLTSSSSESCSEPPCAVLSPTAAARAAARSRDAPAESAPPL